MINMIPGSVAEENDNDPVEVRRYEMITVGPSYPLGYPGSPIYYVADPQPSRYWQYYVDPSATNVTGIIVWSTNTCAMSLFGPILDYWAQQGQFLGPLGCPATDVTQLPDGSSYAVFENGVIWVDTSGNVSTLNPLSPSLIKSFAGVDTTISGITTLAGQQVQAMASQALQNNQQLSDNVSSINATTTFAGVGAGGCSNAGFNSVGTTVARSHSFQVHLDIGLKGCAGTFGGASADFHVTVRLRVQPPNFTAVLEDYHIDGVSSPFGAGDSTIYNGLQNALIQNYGKNMLTQPLPQGITILAGLVDTAGNVNLYIEPFCMPSALLTSAKQPAAQSTLDHLRQLRDQHLLKQPEGEVFVRIVDAMGPVLMHAVRVQGDAPALFGALSRFLVANFDDRTDLPRVAQQITDPVARMARLLELAARVHTPGLLDRLLARATAFVRANVTEGADFSRLMAALTSEVDEEIKFVEGRQAGRRPDA